MSSRKPFFVALFFLTLLIGAMLWMQESTPSLHDTWRWSQIHESTELSRASRTLADAPDNLFLRGYYYWRLLSTNKDLLLYGATALFGIVMMGLAIATVSHGQKDKTHVMVELLTLEKEKAENLARLKSEFLNQVSHELRTPLAVIIGYVECINDGLYGKLEAKHQEILQAVAKQSSHLKNMIDQILIYSRLEASKQPLRIDEFPLNKIINDLRDTFDFLCKQKGLELCWELPREVVTMRSDPDRIKEVVSNLLQNAVKYTDRGSVTVSVHRSTGGNSVMIEVADTGMGIPEQYLSSIFEPFMQAHKTPNDNGRGGIGLGLSIVKKHLEQIGGTISVESEVGRGSRFKITMPRLFQIKKPRKAMLLGLINLSFPRLKKNFDPIHTQTANQVKEVSKTSHAVG
jgi:signal transduction histidine kinase